MRVASKDRHYFDNSTGRVEKIDYSVSIEGTYDRKSIDIG